MRNFRCILLCLTLVLMVGLLAGCSCGRPQDETSANFPEESSSAGISKPDTQDSTQGTTMEPDTSQADIYETGNGMQDSTGGIEDGAGSMGTDEGILPDTGMTNGTDDGLMGDVTDGLDQIGEGISDAVDDVTNGAGTRNR